MIINKKEKFIEVAPEEGKVLYTDGQTFEGLTCPLNADLTIYQEITAEEAEILTKEYIKNRLHLKWGRFYITLP